MIMSLRRVLPSWYPSAVARRMCRLDLTMRGLAAFTLRYESCPAPGPGRQAAYVQRWSVFTSSKALRVVVVVALMPRDRPAQTLDEVHTDVISEILLRAVDICH